MKLIYRNTDSIIIWGTNDNETNVEVIDNNFVVNGSVVARGVDENNFTLVEDANVNLIDPFFVGYVLFVNGVFEYTNEYTLWNEKTHNCISSLSVEYTDKSNDPQYTDEERAAFLEYVDALSLISSVEFIAPYFTYPTPPDEEFPYIPACSL